MSIARQQQGSVVGKTSGAVSTGHEPANLGDILERVLDRGIVIVGDIRISLLDIELLTIKLRLVVASVDTARQMGIDWWEHDPWLSSRARPQLEPAEEEPEALAAPERRSRRRAAERDEEPEALAAPRRRSRQYTAERDEERVRERRD
ncbi:gas vesicle protein [Dactylosporangium sp. CA-092794]|uniref:gas vesicle protein n=1 Tax=Dactylosporangium sp. CA-092794 TaxID=3239929 RepID=UPI003D8CA496